MQHRKARSVGHTMVALLTGILLAAAPAYARASGDLTDRNITTAVERDLLFSEKVPAHRIVVQTHDGVVTLTGDVNYLLAKERAEAFAETIRGVRAVVNNIDVDPTALGDEDVERWIESAFLADPVAEALELTASVEEGIATVTGSVDSWQEKELVESLVKRIHGVIELDSRIEVSTTYDRDDSEIEFEIEKRLENDIWVGSGLITTSVEDGEVVLAGQVGSLFEKRRAAALSWVPGVTSVDNRAIDIASWTDNLDRRKPGFIVKPDDFIQDAVSDAFLYDPRLLAAEPEVVVENGVVTLRGAVSSLQARRAAEEDALNTVGVRRVVNRLRLDIEADVPDHVLTDRVTHAVLRDPVLKSGDITVSSHNGTVYLTGSVRSLYEKDHAHDVVTQVKDVAAVSNSLDVVSPWQAKPDWEIREDIQSELFWDMTVDADDVTVTVRGGAATLEGTVDTFHEWRAALNNAFEGGARRVHNELTIRQDPDFTG